MKWTVGRKIALLGTVGLAALMIFGGISLWGSEGMKEASERALLREAQARSLAELNADLIDLLFLAVDSPARPEKGISSENIIQRAAELAERAERVVSNAPGAEKIIIESNQLTLGDQVAGNFRDVADALSFELPEIYDARGDHVAFDAARGSMVITLVRFYDFISRSLGQLADNASREAQVARAEMMATRERAQNAMLGVGILTLLILGPAFFGFRRHLVEPLKKTVTMAEGLKSGRVDGRLDFGGRRDEFGAMSHALNAFAESLESDVVAVMKAVARGDLNVETHPADEQDVLRGTLQSMRANLYDLVSGLRRTAAQLSSGSAQVSGAAQSLSEGATRQASAL